MKQLDGKRVLITGGTGSLGSRLVKRLLTDEAGEVESITVYSRDEAKQHRMRLEYQNERRLRFIIGDVRDYEALRQALSLCDVAFHAAAMKHVTICEHNPREAVLTNIYAALNIVRAIRDGVKVETVVNVSSDKGCYPINTYGASKFLAEKILLEANNYTGTRIICTCYGNVMASRGSVIERWIEQINSGGVVEITEPSMTRFLISIDQAADTLIAALENARRGEIYVPKLPAATVGDLAKTLVNGKGTQINIIGIRPGEKMHETLITEEEARKTIQRGNYYVVCPQPVDKPALSGSYCSADYVIDALELKRLLVRQGFLAWEEVLA